MKTAAERVSTEPQLQLIRALGVDKIQGYIFSRPVTSTTVKAMLGQNRKLAAASLRSPVAIVPPMRQLPCAGRGSPLRTRLSGSRSVAQSG